MWFIGVEVEQETSAPPPKKKPGSAPVSGAKGATKEDTVILSWMEGIFLCTAQILCL